MLKQMHFHLIGHGHIDPVFLWCWQEGFAEVRATFRSALARMKENSNFHFSASSACFYNWVKECEPELFEEIRARVAEGRWEIVGAWWIEPDCNIPHGESFVRQGLYGQSFFKKEFGKIATVGFNPDSFGHAGNLPQILSKSGVKYYSYLRPQAPQEKSYPEGSTFWWVAPDQSRLLTCNIFDIYGSNDNVLTKIMQQLKSPYNNAGQKTFMNFYGVGDHGGGPTKLAIQLISDAQNAAEYPRLSMSTMQDYFEEFLHEHSTIPSVKGELQHHARGCYSVVNVVKMMNRKTEHALLQAERLHSLTWLMGITSEYPRACLETAWKDLLFNQFHDILGGSSVYEAYPDALAQMGRAKYSAEYYTNMAIQKISAQVNTTVTYGHCIFVFNSLPWAIKSVITISSAAITQCIISDSDEKVLPFVHAAFTRWTRAQELENHRLVLYDIEGLALPIQKVVSSRIAANNYRTVLSLPAFGYTTLYLQTIPKTDPEIARCGTLCASTYCLENDFWCIDIDVDGTITLYDKKQRLHILKRGLVLTALIDTSDTWSHDVSSYRVEAGKFKVTSIRVIEIGEVCATVQIDLAFAKSRAVTQLTLYKTIDTIDCKLRINWQEQHTALKFGFDTYIDNAVFTCDAPYSTAVRALTGEEEVTQSFVDLTGRINGQAYGFSLLNDGVYACDARESSISMTLLRSPTYADGGETCYKADDIYYPFTDQGWHTFKFQLMPHLGQWEDSKLLQKSWELQVTPFVHFETQHEGTLPKYNSFMQSDAKHTVVTVLKCAENCERLIIRAYEFAGKEEVVTVNFPTFNKSIKLNFKAFEIKTISIDPKNFTWFETDLLEVKI